MWRWLALGMCLLLVGCATPAPSASLLPPTATRPTSPTPTAPPTATSTAAPTAAPTIVIGLLTPTLTPTFTTPPLATPTLAATAAFTPGLRGLPEPVFPEPLGVQIHFQQPVPGEVAALHAAGFGLVRHDLFWSEIERERGVYDFSGYDGLVAALSRQGLRILLILDYGNGLYDNGRSPHTDESRAAFARFAATAARRYRRYDILWEIWNEPNIDRFWHPEPNARDYALLAITTAAAIRRADPTAVVIAPAVVHFQPEYWTTLGELGLFRWVDAVSVHPYGVGEPEDALEGYLWLRRLIDHYSPAWRAPIVNSEAGYSSLAGGFSEQAQAQYLARQSLFSMAHDVRFSVWYDWRNNGTDPAEIEHNFGVVTYAFERKPAYYAARTLAETLDGYRFVRRMAVGGPDDYVLLFQKDASLALAAWTVTTTHTITLPLPLAEVEVVEMLGTRGVLFSGPEAFELPLGPAPRYVLLGAADALAPLAGWRPYETFHRAAEGVRVVVDNPFANPRHTLLEVRIGREVVGATEIAVPPGETRHARIPVDVARIPAGALSRAGDARAEVRCTPVDRALWPLQGAVIWVQVTP